MSSAKDSTENFKINSEIWSAISRDDVDTLKHLLDTPGSDEILDEDGDNLLHLSIISEKFEIFDYLLSLDKFDLNAKNKNGETALVLSLCYYNEYTDFIDEYFAIELLKKGADIYTVYNNNTILHLAMLRHYIKVAQILIENGADVNAQNDSGCTPLHMLFHMKTDPIGVTEGVGLMMYYGADSSICDNNGNIPFELAVIYDPDIVVAQENLFYYTFDSHSDYKMSSEVLYEMLQNAAPLCLQIMDNVAEVIFIDRVYFPPYLLFTFEPEVVKGLIEKFGYVVCDILMFNASVDWRGINSNFMQNWNMLLESHLTSNAIEFIGNIKMDWLITQFKEDEVSRKLATEFTFFLLSYGLNVSEKAVQKIYKTYGYCDLFKSLLHMDIQMADTLFNRIDIIPRIIYDVQLELGTFLSDPHTYSLNAIEQLLDYFANPKLKIFCLQLGVTKLVTKASTLPNVPLLVELARDAVRRSLVQEFNIKSSKQFYTVLKSLPISRIHERIISFETKLYHYCTDD